MKLIVKSDDSEIEAEAMIDGKVKKFGSAAHVIVPKKWIGHDVVVLIKEVVRGWNEGYLKRAKKHYTRKEIEAIEDKKIREA